MSRIGKQPIEIPAGVTIPVGDSEITVAGPKGQLIVPVQPKTKVAIAHTVHITNGNHTFDKSPAMAKVITSKEFANGKKCIISLKICPIIDKSNHMPDSNAATLTKNDAMPDTALSGRQEPSNRPKPIYINADGKDNKMPSKMLKLNCKPNKIDKPYTATH